jgi:TatD DNase family protein
MHIVDSHAHLDSYKPEELPGVLERSWEAGVRTVLAIGIGDGPEEMYRALEIADSLSGANAPTPELFASAGIHPQEAHRATPEALKQLAMLAARPRCIAVGEIGLDYYHAGNPDIATQKEAFVAQMRVAAETRSPILIHCRTSELARPDAKAKYGTADAWEDLLELIAAHWTKHGVPGVMHCFSGTVEQARRSLELGFFLSFAGNLTYPAAAGIREAAAMVPADRMLVETDAPFLAPVPHRGTTNEPAYTAVTAAYLAELRGVGLAEVAEQTTANFRRIFPAAAPSVG